MKTQIVQNQQEHAFFEIKAQSAGYKSLFATQNLKVNTVIFNFSYEEKTAKKLLDTLYKLMKENILLYRPTI